MKKLKRIMCSQNLVKTLVLFVASAWTLFAAAEGPGTYFVPPKGTDNVVSPAQRHGGCKRHKWVFAFYK